jgi:hypothetical protein
LVNAAKVERHAKSKSKTIPEILNMFMNPPPTQI